MVEKVLIVAPHPDDETLGCGGSLLRHKSEGDQIHWLIMTTVTEDVGYSQQQISSRETEIEKVAAVYGFPSFLQTNFVTTTLDTYSKSVLIREVSSYFSEVQPNIIYLPFRNDVHSDHAAVFDAVAACSKSFRYPYIRKVRAYETLSETEFSIRPDKAGFSPNLWIDISEYLDRKIEIMRMYEGEMGKHPFPRSEQNIRALASYRGAVAGVLAAEAFVSMKEIV
jgi:N-acetylglucosamine malate deacetylase 1